MSISLINLEKRVKYWIVFLKMAKANFSEIFVLHVYSFGIWQYNCCWYKLFFYQIHFNLCNNKSIKIWVLSPKERTKKEKEKEKEKVGYLKFKA